MRPGVRLGIDVGQVRVGVARSDPAGTLAFPVETLKRGNTDIPAICKLAREYEVLEILVGLPLSLSGKAGKAAEIARAYAHELAVQVSPTPVKLVDERLTTIQAERSLRDSGISTRQGRAVVDQAAAVVIVQHALESERQSDEPLGITVRTP